VKILGALMLSGFLKWGFAKNWGLLLQWDASMPCVGKGEKEMAKA
jgi:hypothetical protein